MSGPKLVFALARGQNVFFRELAEALAFELERLGARAEISQSGLPEQRAGLVTVLMPPHEFVALSGVRPHFRTLRRCILISAEQPSSGFFASNLELARDAGGVLDINRRAVRAYRDAGIAAEHLQLGHSAAWDRRGSAERDIDVLFMGRATDRRERALASYADALERFNCQFVLSDNARASAREDANFIAGEKKLNLLARTKVLLNLHGENEPYFEWLRVCEAMSAGCAIVTEHSTDLDPLRPGEDIVVGRLEALGLLAAWIAEDDEERRRVVQSADSRLQGQASLAEAAKILLANAERVDSTGIDPYTAKSAMAAATRIALHPPVETDTPSDAEPLRPAYVPSCAR